MRLLSVELKNFRCFPTVSLHFDHRITLIEGLNGSGKSSLVEALYYACYFKSFRTNHGAELIRHGQEAAYIKIICNDDQYIQIGLADKKRVVRFNGKLLTSYKELISEYRVVVVIEDDIQIIKGAPETRRDFIDQALILYKSNFATLLKTYRKTLQQRNALLYFSDRWNYESYCIWTEKLFTVAEQIRQERLELLDRLESEVNKLLVEFFPELSDMSFEYCKAELEEELLATHRDAADEKSARELKGIEKEVDEGKVVIRRWISAYGDKERVMRRSLCGPHLDDIRIVFSGKSSRQFASRGQQKLIAVLLKAALIKILQGKTVIVLDDFMTDFDDIRMQALLKLFISYGTHVICTTPSRQSALCGYLQEQQCDVITL